MLSMYLAMLEDDADKELFAHLYQLYFDKMTRAAQSILPNETQAEDAVHDAFLKMIQHFDDLKQIPEERRFYWMLAVTKNASLDLLRKNKKEFSMDEDQWPEPVSAPQDDSGFHALVAVIRSMPETYRRVLELRYVTEWSQAEIAAELQISEGTVKSKIFRGRQILIERMAKEGYVCE